MALLTMIARAVDGLPLAASMPSDEETSRNIQEYQNQGKMILKKLTERSPPQCSIESGEYVFHYLIDNGVCYLVLCEKSFPKRMAFSYLDEIKGEFISQYLGQVPTAIRPYCFIEFDTFLQKAKKKFADSKNRRNLNRLNDDLLDVQRIMMQNIDDVLQRGENLSGIPSYVSSKSLLFMTRYRPRVMSSLSCWLSSLLLGVDLVDSEKSTKHNTALDLVLPARILDDKAGQLRFQSDKFKKQARWLNLRSVYAKYAAVGLVFFIFVIYVRYWWL